MAFFSALTQRRKGLDSLRLVFFFFPSAKSNAEQSGCGQLTSPRTQRGASAGKEGASPHLRARIQSQISVLLSTEAPGLQPYTPPALNQHWRDCTFSWESTRTGTSLHSSARVGQGHRHALCTDTGVLSYLSWATGSHHVAPDVYEAGW